MAVRPDDGVITSGQERNTTNCWRGSSRWMKNNRVEPCWVVSSVSVFCAWSWRWRHADAIAWRHGGLGRSTIGCRWWWMKNNSIESCWDVSSFFCARLTTPNEEQRLTTTKPKKKQDWPTAANACDDSNVSDDSKGDAGTWQQDKCNEVGEKTTVIHLDVNIILLTTQCHNFQILGDPLQKTQMWKHFSRRFWGMTHIGRTLRFLSLCT